MGDDRKRKAAGGLGVSTGVEKAWYMRPDLLAGEEGQARPISLDPKAPDPPNTTVHLGESELEEAEDELAPSDEDARHYEAVSLRGALLAREVPEPTPSVLDGFRRLRQRAADNLRTSGGTGASATLKDRVLRLLAALGDFSIVVLAQLARALEPGVVPPVLLVAISFVLGIILTLFGVALAL